MDYVGYLSSSELGLFQGAVIAVGLTLFHHGYRRLRKQQTKVIRHRDQKSTIAYAKRIKRHKIRLRRDDLPVGTHLLMSGFLVTINGIVYDVGFPSWMSERVPKSSEKGLKPRLSRRANKLSRERIQGKRTLLMVGGLNDLKKKALTYRPWKGLLDLSPIGEGNK